MEKNGCRSFGLFISVYPVSKCSIFVQAFTLISVNRKFYSDVTYTVAEAEFIFVTYYQSFHNLCIVKNDYLHSYIQLFRFQNQTKKLFENFYRKTFPI